MVCASLMHTPSWGIPLFYPEEKETMLQNKPPTSEPPSIQTEGPTSAGEVGQDKQKSSRWFFFFFFLTAFWSDTDRVALCLGTWYAVTRYPISSPSPRSAWGEVCLYKYYCSQSGIAASFLWACWRAGLRFQKTNANDERLASLSSNVHQGCFLRFPGVKMGFHVYCRYYFCNFAE